MSNAPLGPPDDAANTYRSPSAENTRTSLPPLQTGLGSLAQEARLKHLNTAKWILIVVGILTIGVNAFQYANIEEVIDDELAQVLKREGVARNEVDPGVFNEVRQTAIQNVRLLCGALILVGFAYIGMGIFVKRYPVPLTIAGLVLYVAAALIFAVLNPMTLVQGIIFKILIVVGLAKAVQAALAYERERKAAAEMQFAA
jgi:hypothetical protein